MAKEPEHTSEQFESLPSSPEQVKRAKQLEGGGSLRKRGHRFQVIATTTTGSGQVIDWIDPSAQVLTGHLPSPPPSETKLAKSQDHKRSGVPVIFELDEQPKARGPVGTVPIPRPARHATGVDKSLQGVVLKWSDKFSLGEVGLAHVDATGLVKEALSAGWRSSKENYSAVCPSLFVSYTTNSYTAEGDDLGGDNREVAGWVQISRTQCPAGRLVPMSPNVGGQLVHTLTYQFFRGNWWLSAAGEWIGFYPATLFSKTGLARSANSTYLLTVTLHLKENG